MSVIQRLIRRREAGAACLPDGLHPVLRRVYAARAVGSGDELDTQLGSLLPPDALGGMAEAAALLETALREGRRILVVGDFDADGATSCALMVEALQAMGAASVGYLVPDRFAFGYGLTPAIVEVAAERRPDLLVTVDNGISSVEGVAAARERGMQVLVTDHHLPGPALPEAEAIVNPNLPGDPFPSKHLAGVGVAFYLMVALRGRLRAGGWFGERGLREPKLAELLDLVALGTVADVVPLDRNNRILVQQGLSRIRAGCCRPGIRALIEVSGRNGTRLVAADLGFALGPRLNAAGRLDDMSVGIECLLARDPVRARELAQQLDDLNRERREIEADMQEGALRAIESLRLDEAKLPLGLCLYDPAWHQGVIGILASRIKERFQRPVIAFADAGGGELKGSARSVAGLHIRDVLDAVAASHPGLLTKFGGHAMAAGMTLEAGRLQDFSAAFDAEVRRELNGRPPDNILESDGELAADEFSLELAELLRSAGPWGQGFPEPLFDGLFEVVYSRLVGERHLKFGVRPQGGRQVIDAIAFNQGDHHPLTPGSRVRLAYRLDANEFRGLRSLQLVVEYMEEV